jgi:hypothetical protein
MSVTTTTHCSSAKTSWAQLPSPCSWKPRGRVFEEIGRILGKVIVQYLARVQVKAESEMELKKKK